MRQIAEDAYARRVAELTGDQAARSGWLFGRTADLAIFGGSALLSLGLLVIGKAGGVLAGEVPAWLFLGGIVLVDVAHVWSTAFRVYFDPAEVRRRPGLYLGAPVALWVAGVALHAHGSLTFWRVLAYVAVFHFVRQQAGFAALFARASGAPRVDRLLDQAAIYAATLYPLVFWHAHLPRAFSWLLDGDFVSGLPQAVVAPAFALHAAVLAVWGARQVQLAATGARRPGGSALWVFATWACWYGGIVVFDSDYAFTATNVFLHGVPYLALTLRYGRGRFAGTSGWQAALVSSVVPALLLLGLVAFGEEAVWDRFIWREHAWLFGGWGTALTGGAATLLVPLLALPQATHYLLDGFVWKTRDNPALAERLGFVRNDPAQPPYKELNGPAMAPEATEGSR